jgi:hypothetical protein
MQPQTTSSSLSKAKQLILSTVPDCLSTGMNETQAAVATMSIQGPLAGKYYAMMGLAMHEALSAGGAPPPALAGTCNMYKRPVTRGPLNVTQGLWSV